VISGSRAMHSRNLLIIIAGLLIIGGSGCVCVDGGFRFHVRARLCDSENNVISIGQAGWTLYGDKLTEEDILWEKLPPIDPNGYTEEEVYSMLSWGGCYIAFLWPPEPPVPENPGTLWLLFKDAVTTEIIEVPVSPAAITKAERGKLWIDLGTVTVHLNIGR
jgi:hypothetical protein